MAKIKKRKGDFDGWAVIYSEEIGGEILPAYIHIRANVQNYEIIGKLAVKIDYDFLLVDYFDKEYIAQNALKYTKTKFFRAILQFQKLCQFNPYDSPSAFKGSAGMVRDDRFSWFDNGFSIDWNKSISEIDQQLYKLFGLPQHCIDFIESKFGDAK